MTLPAERVFSPQEIASALTVAADEIEWQLEHGLHEFGIPVPEILRSLVGVTAREAEGNRRLFARIDALETVLQEATEALTEIAYLGTDMPAAFGNPESFYRARLNTAIGRAARSEKSRAWYTAQRNARDVLTRVRDPETCLPIPAHDCPLP